MKDIPIYKSIRFYLLLLPLSLGLIFILQIIFAFNDSISRNAIYYLSIIGFIIGGANIYFVTSRLEKELYFLRQSIRNVINQNFSRKFKMHAMPVKDEISAISNEVSVMLDKVHQRTTEVLKRRMEIDAAYKNIEKLGVIGREVGSHRTVEGVIKSAFENISQLVSPSLIALGIYDDQNNGMNFYGMRAGSGDLLKGFEDMTDPNRWSVYCYDSEKEIFCNQYDCGSGKYFSSILFNEPMDIRESFIYFPLSHRKRKIGVFSVQSFERNAFTTYHLGLLRNFTNYLTIALLNAEAYSQIENQKQELIDTFIQLEEARDNLEKQVDERTRELQIQKLEIEEKNHELERLSLVARKTDNAIMIMDASGNVKWINDCFSRIYNYTLDEFINKRGTNILQTSFNPEIETILDKCLTTKKSVFYEALNITGDGKEIWTQTTLTPVINDKCEITHLLTIDSDITQRKEYELRIFKQSQDITNSIKYARQIQKAVLPPEDLFKSWLHEYFILYLPKDIVSGDFYWISKKENKILIALSDCTGHGVPGAFMSMLGVSLLNEIVSNDKWKNAADILNILRIKVKRALQQETNKYRISDGMDISLCIIDKETMNLDFAGANNSLYLVRSNEVEEYKGDKMPIGVYVTDNLLFRSIDIKFEHENTIYLSTDGYLDQFGGVKNKKFGIRMFKQLLQEVASKPIDEQKNFYLQTIRNWQGNEHQIDDITMIGFKV
jgi:PAS domain S-box-containing protein